MDRLDLQRGYKSGKVILVILVIAAGYLGMTFWPVARAHYRIKNDAKRLANRILTRDGSDPESHVQRFIKVLADREDLVLTRSEVTLDDSDHDYIEVSVRVELPYEYPFLGEERVWATTIEVFAERARGF